MAMQNTLIINAQNILRKIISIFCIITVISLALPVITMTSAYALAPVVALESKLDDDTGIIAPASNFPRDGMAPFVALDPNDNNGTVATMDITQHKFDVSVNTLNGASHNVTALTKIKQY